MKNIKSSILFLFLLVPLLGAAQVVPISFLQRNAVPSIVTNSLILNLDAGDITSYAGTGTTWINKGTGGTTYNATMYSNPSNPTFTVNGTASYFNFNGTNGFSLARPVQDNMTWAAWIKTSQTGGGSGQFYTAYSIFGGEMPGGTNDYAVVMGNGKLGFGNGANDITSYTTKSINDNLWHYITVTRNATSGEVNLYIDGVLDKTFTTSTGSLTAPSKIGIAYNANVTGDPKFAGNIAIAQAYSIVLTAKQVLDNFEALKSRFGY